MSLKTVDRILIINNAGLINTYNRQERRKRKEPKNIMDKLIVFDEPLSNQDLSMNYQQIWNFTSDVPDNPDNQDWTNGQTIVELQDGTPLNGALIVASQNAIKLTLNKSAVTQMIKNQITTLHFRLQLKKPINNQYLRKE